MNASIAAVAVGWGGLAFFATRRLVRRVSANERARDLRPDDSPTREAAVFARMQRAYGRAIDALGPAGRVLRGAGRARARRQRERRMAHELPAAIDLLAVAVSSGATPFGAIETAARWSPSGVGAAFASVLTACRLGATFDGALRQAAQRDATLAPLASVLRTGTRLGAPVNDALARLAAEARRDLRRRAETRARTVPVRLLFPLVFLVLPAFGLLTVVPAVAAGFHGF